MWANFLFSMKVLACHVSRQLKQSLSDKGSDRGLDPQELIDLHEVLLLTLHFPTLPLYSVVLK